MRNVDSILKSRDIALLTKVCIIKAMVFPAVIYRCKSWTIKNAEPQRIDAFELWCWRRLLRVPSTARRSNQSILKEINPEYSLERLMLKLKLQYFGHLMQRANSLEKTLMLGKIEGRKRQGQQRMRWLDGITDPMDMSLSKLQTGKPAVHGIAKSWTWLSDWTELDCCCCLVAKLCLTLLRLHWLWPTRLLFPWISQARILEWVAISLSRGSSWPRDWIWVFCIGRLILYHWTTRKASMCIYIRRRQWHPTPAHIRIEQKENLSWIVKERSLNCWKNESQIRKGDG